MVIAIDEGEGLNYYCEVCYSLYDSYNKAFLCERKCNRIKNNKPIGVNKT